jgi:hypothetical protein
MRALLSLRKPSSLVLAAALAVLLSGCGSTVESRIKEQPEAYAKLPASDQALVREGKIREGMDRSAVYIAWGKPAEVYMGQRAGRQTEVWQYFRQRSHVIHSTPYPYFPGGYYYDLGPTIITEDIPGKRATFINGRVSEWVVPYRGH